MRVVILSPYQPGKKGGISRFILNLISGLEKVGVPSSPIARRSEAFHGKDGFTESSLSFILRAFLSLLRESPDVVHAHSHWFTLAPGVIYKFLRPRVVLVFSFHTMPVEPRKSLGVAVLRELLSFCDATTFVSRSLLLQSEQIFSSRGKKRVVHPSVLEVPVSEEEAEAFLIGDALNDMTPLLCFIGPLVWKLKSKGVETLIRSLAIVKETYPGAGLVVCGDGPYRSDLEMVAGQLGLEDSVRFTGFIPNPEAALLACDIYTHITYQEGLPHSILEAMLIEKPVVASKVGGIPEVLQHEHNGLLVENDPRMISTTISGLFGNPRKMRDLGENARKHILRRFSCESMVKDFLRIYEGD